MKPSVYAVAASLVFLLSCSLFGSPAGGKAVLVAKDVACVIEHAYLDDEVLNNLCDLLTVERQTAGHAVAASYRGQIQKDMASRSGSATDGGDAGDGGDGGREAGSVVLVEAGPDAPPAKDGGAR